MVTGPLAPLEAADALIYTRETIYNVASKYGLRATFAPRVNATKRTYHCLPPPRLACVDTKVLVGTGQHVHISLHSTDSHRARHNAQRSASSASHLTRTEGAFIQAVVDHLPALCALMLPTPQSYWRVQDGRSTGGTYACWGTDNKDAPLRVCGESGSRHIEAKTPDGTASPYLVLAGVLSVGLYGVLRSRDLKTPDCTKPISTMTEEEKKKAKVENLEKLPRSVEEARRLLAQNAVLREGLGSEFIDKYLSVNEVSLPRILHRLTIADQHRSV